MTYKSALLIAASVVLSMFVLTEVVLRVAQRGIESGWVYPVGFRHPTSDRAELTLETFLATTDSLYFFSFCRQRVS
jgi:hypothetical protein